MVEGKVRAVRDMHVVVGMKGGESVRQSRGGANVGVVTKGG